MDFNIANNTPLPLSFSLSNNSADMVAEISGFIRMSGTLNLLLARGFDIVCFYLDKPQFAGSSHIFKGYLYETICEVPETYSETLNSYINADFLKNIKSNTLDNDKLYVIYIKYIKNNESTYIDNVIVLKNTAFEEDKWDFDPNSNCYLEEREQFDGYYKNGILGEIHNSAPIYNEQ